MVVVGTRPEAIKMAPVAAALRAIPELESRVVLTGQHEGLVDDVADAVGLRADAALGVMRAGQSVHDVVRAVIAALGDEVRDWRPDALLVQGDTATVFASALVGFLERVKVGHVEAGLRSGDKWAPFPEEMFRRLTDVLSDYYFAPTPGAAEHLRREGVPHDRIHVTGNPVVDALRRVAERPWEADDPVVRALLGELAGEGEGRLALVTAHRRESFGEPLQRVFGAIRALADRTPDLRVLYPVHPNPAVQGPARAALSGHPRIHLTGPLGYLDLVAAMRAASIVLTDSGGIQEEAPTFGVPVLVLRDVTERPEGGGTLVGTDPDAILAAAERALAPGRAARQPPPNPYGDGRAGERIADIVAADLLGRPRRTGEWGG